MTAPSQNNIVISFPDGKNTTYTKGVTGYEIAESISKSLFLPNTASKASS